jgi:hypothetical protein
MAAHVGEKMKKTNARMLGAKRPRKTEIGLNFNQKINQQKINCKITIDVFVLNDLENRTCKFVHQLP